MQNNFQWHNLKTRRVLEILDSHPEKGLSGHQAKERRKKYGLNELPREKPLSKTRLFFSQFRSPLIYILVVAAGVAFLLDKRTDFIVILAAVILNVSFGFFQEHKASQALHKLKQVIQIKARVLRQDHLYEIEARELVPGDIISINPGSKIPADARLLEAHNLKINEAILTGEWLAQEKKVGRIPSQTPLADRNNLVFMGTTVEEGRGKAIVIEVGLNTEIGKIAHGLREVKEEATPLQKRLSHFSKILGLAIFALSALILGGGLWQKQPLAEILTTTIAIVVAAIPEGLPVTMTVILALGMQRILQRKGLVRKLVAAETLGSASIICADKTLTLTQGKMAVAEIFAFRGRKEKEVLQAAALANEAHIENPQEPFSFWKIRGRPTDQALILAAAKAKINKAELDQEFVELARLPFNSKNKFIASLRKVANQKILYLAGAPEKIIKLCLLDKKSLVLINARLSYLTSRGQRVIAVADKKIPNKNYLLTRSDLLSLSSQSTLLGLIALRDPLRKGVKKAIRIAQEAGIKPIIISGDHLLTTRAVAQELGLKTKKENIIEGAQLDQWSEKELQEKIEQITVYARAEPHHKLRIIRAWQDKGEVVAMTGDGINDAPALKKADIGVVMGSATDVAKELADLVLLDDNLETIIAAIEEGRGILDNLRKVITYLLSDSFSETILVGASVVLGLPLPITAAQILWVNLIEDSLPAMALVFEPREKEIMQKPPLRRDAPLLTNEMKTIIFIIGLFTDLILLALFLWLWSANHSIDYIRTMVFAGLALDSLFYVFSCRSLRKNLWQFNLFSNRALVAAVAIGTTSLLVVLYFPPLQKLLNVTPLIFSDWLILISLGIIEIVSIEVVKYYFNVRQPTQNYKQLI